MATADVVIKATIQTLQAAGLEVSISTVGGVAEVVVTDRDTGERYVVRDPDAKGWRKGVDFGRPSRCGNNGLRLKG